MALCSAPHREKLALGLLGDALYLAGGQVRERHQQVVTASVLRWPLSGGGGWLSSSPLPLPLACHSAVSLQGELYVLGGWTPQVDHLTVSVSSFIHVCHSEAPMLEFSWFTLMVYDVGVIVQSVAAL